jgi:lysophospholipase L1-like esterase
MKTRTVISTCILIAVGLLVISGCATGRKAVSGAEWDYVALGDSRTAWTSYPDLYAAHIEADIGVKVIVHNEAIGGQWTGSILWYIRNDDSWREKISEAEIVTILTEESNLFYNLSLFSKCDNNVVEDFEKNLDEVIAEIYSLRGRQKTIIRLIENYHYNVELHKERGVFETMKMCVNAYNERLHKVASKYKIPVAPIYLGFNGPNGDESPGVKGYFKDSSHTNETGDVIIADLLRELGYEPFVD